jgi:hypothetical protein
MFYHSFQLQPIPTKIPKDYPSWASWKSREVYLPPQIHSSRSFKTTLALVKRDLVEVEAGNVDPPLLLLGLVYREVCRAMEAEPGEETTAPAHLINSQLGVKQLDEIEKVLNDVDFDNS